MKLSYKYFLFTLLLIIIDQVLKLWMHYIVVPNHFGNIDLIPDFLKLHYVTNPGMAFGIELGGDYGKPILTTFRLIAMFAIAWYLNHQAQKTPDNGLLWAIGAILAGAIGNLVDSIFYGVFLSGNAILGAPTPWFHGQVIDMFYFNFLDGVWPEWIPLVGGDYHLTPIFNFADACIFCGVVTILIFQKRFLEMKPLDDDFVKHITEIDTNQTSEKEENFNKTEDK